MLGIHTAHAWSKKKEAKERIEPQPSDLPVVVQTTGPRTQCSLAKVKLNPSDATSSPWSLDEILGFHFQNHICGRSCFRCGSAFCTLQKKKDTKTKQKRIKNNVLDPGLGCYHCTMVTSRAACKKYVTYCLGKRLNTKIKQKPYFQRRCFWIILWKYAAKRERKNAEFCRKTSVSPEEENKIKEE